MRNSSRATSVGRGMESCGRAILCQDPAIVGNLDPLESRGSEILRRSRGNTDVLQGLDDPELAFWLSRGRLLLAECAGIHRL